MIKMIELPYPMNALEPYYSKETLELHYKILYKGYVDNTNANLPLLEQIYKEISDLRKDRDKGILNDKDKISRSNAILNNFEKLLNIVGRDKFIFYEDGGIEYKWDMSLLKGDCNNGKR